MTARRQTTLLSVAAALALVAGGCGDEEGSAPDAAPPGGESIEVEIVEFEYVPETVTVPVGGEVTWTNSDEAPHTATADDGSFDTGKLKLDGTGTVVFDEPGSFEYYCRFHAFMRASVEVEG
jgi:plastocyanin